MNKLGSELAAGDAFVPFVADATDYLATVAAVDAALKRFGRLDYAVANAGFSTGDTLASGDPERWRDMVLTNVLGPALLAKAVLAPVTESRGRIVFIGSVAGTKHTPGNVYSATKWAVTALAENTRQLVTSQGVGVTLVAPGRVETPFWGEKAPEGPLLDADAVADTIAWVVDQPQSVDVNTVVVRPTGQRI